MKRIFLIFLFVSIIFLSACSDEKPNKINYKPQGEIYDLKTGSIIPGSSYVGNIDPLKQTNLSPKVGGRISEIYVKEGDTVKAGDLLAKLKGDEIAANFSSTKNMLSANQRLYQNTQSFFDQQIKSTKTRVDTAKENMEIAKQQLEGAKTGTSNTKNVTQQQIQSARKQVNEAEVSVETAKSQLKNTKQTLKQREKNIYSNAKNALSKSKIVSTNLLNFVDENLGISDENESKNDSFENYIGAKNSSLKNKTKSQWRVIKNNFKIWKKETEDLISDINNTKSVVENDKLKEKTYAKLQEGEKILKNLRSLASNMYEVIDSSVTSNNFSQQKVDNLKSMAVDYQNKVEDVLLTAQGDYLMGIKGSIQSIDNFEKEYNSKIDVLNNKLQLSKSKLQTAEQNLQQYKAQSQSQVDKVSTDLQVAKRRYNISKKKYEEAKSNLQALKEKKEQQLSQISSTIAKIQGDQDVAGTKLGNTRIYAPYDGVITHKHFDLGQVVSSQNPIVTIADKSSYKIKIFIPASKTNTIKEGDKVQIKVRPLDKYFSGEVKNIFPASNISSKRIPVEIGVNGNTEEIKIGMYSDVYFQSEKISGLKIPQRFLRYRYGEPFVNVYKNGNIETQKITVKDCNNKFCIVNGDINKGEKLINK